MSLSVRAIPGYGPQKDRVRSHRRGNSETALDVKMFGNADIADIATRPEIGTFSRLGWENDRAQACRHMPIPQEALDEFIDIWEREFGERLTRDCATYHANRLLSFYRGLAKEFQNGPIPLAAANEDEEHGAP
jgi:hypothetical protein